MSAAIPQGDAAAYIFNIVVGPTYNPTDFAPTLQLLSERFEGELWSYGSYHADVTIGRMHLNVVKANSRTDIANFARFSQRVLRRARDLQKAAPRRFVVTSYDPFKGGLLARLVAKRLNGPFVCEINGNYGDPDNFAHVESRIWRQMRLTQMRLMGSYTLRGATAVRLLFDDQLRNFVTLPSDAIVRRFPCLTATDRFYSGAEEPLILSAGFPFEVKGMDVLASAFVRLAPKYPEWRLVLIGHRVPDKLSAFGVTCSQITALPGIPQDQLAAWMSRCAIFALASRSEAMGRVLLEAAAAGKCRIATNVGGIPTVIEGGQDGLLVGKESVEDLEQGLELLINDSSLRRRLGRAAKDRVDTEFTASRYLASYKELIESTLRAAGHDV